MEARALGSSGLRVTPIGLGLAALGRPGYLNLGHGDDLAGATSVEALERRCHHVLDAAFAAGVRYFDAARSYGRAEAFLGSWLRVRSITPGAITIGSKWGYMYTAGWRADAKVHEVKDHSLATLARQLDESRALLGGHLALYQIHSATLDSRVLEDRAVIDRLRALRDGGLRIGLSLSGSAQADTLRRALELRLFQGVQATWNLLERSVEPALLEARRAGLGVIVKEALANGRLAPRNQEPKLALLDREARALGMTRDALAIAAVLARPFVSVVLSGASTLSQLTANLDALRVSYSDDVDARLAALVEPAREYWAARSRLTWT